MKRKIYLVYVLCLWVPVFIYGCVTPGDAAKESPIENCNELQEAPQVAVPEFLIISHRGLATEEPENTIEAFEAALKDGANALEIDLSLTQDKQVVVWHDWNPNDLVAIGRRNNLAEWHLKYRPLYRRCPNPSLPVHDLTLKSFRECYGYAERQLYPEKTIEAHIPTFEEFFSWATTKPGLKYVFLDIKIPENEVNLAPLLLSKINQTLKHFNPGFNFVLLTPYDRVLEAMKRACPKFLYSFDRELPGGIILIHRHFSSISKAIEYNNVFASVGRPTKWTVLPWRTYKKIILIDLELREKYLQYHAKKIHLISWTINEESEMEELIRLGVQGIITDYPARLKKVLQRVNGTRN